MLKPIPTIIISSAALLFSSLPGPHTSFPDGFNGLEAKTMAQAIETKPEAKIEPLDAAPIPAKQATCAQFKEALYKYDWDVNIIFAIAMGESGCRWAIGDTTLTFQQNGRTYGYSVGFLQYRILPGREACEDTTLDAYVACNYRLFAAKRTYTDWTIYNNQSYRKHL